MVTHSLGLRTTLQCDPLGARQWVDTGTVEGKRTARGCMRIILCVPTQVAEVPRNAVASIAKLHNQATPDRQEPGHTDDGTQTRAHRASNQRDRQVRGHTIAPYLVVAVRQDGSPKGCMYICVYCTVQGSKPLPPTFSFSLKLTFTFTALHARCQAPGLACPTSWIRRRRPARGRRAW